MAASRILSVRRTASSLRVPRGILVTTVSPGVSRPSDVPGVTLTLRFCSSQRSPGLGARIRLRGEFGPCSTRAPVWAKVSEVTPLGSGSSSEISSLQQNLPRGRGSFSLSRPNAFLKMMV